MKIFCLENSPQKVFLMSLVTLVTREVTLNTTYVFASYVLAVMIQLKAKETSILFFTHIFFSSSRGRGAD